MLKEVYIDDFNDCYETIYIRYGLTSITFRGINRMCERIEWSLKLSFLLILVQKEFFLQFEFPDIVLYLHVKLKWHCQSHGTIRMWRYGGIAVFPL